MADDELGAWDDEDYAPPDLKVPDVYGEEVVKKLDDEEDKKPELPAPANKKKQGTEKAKKQQAKGKPVQQQSLEEAETKQLTAQELEDLQRASDLAAAAETFGGRESSLCGSIDDFEPRSEEEFKTLVTLLSSKLGPYQKNEHYFQFLSHLFRELCLTLDSKHILHYGKELSALASEKSKEEKEKEKAKQPKKKKPTLTAGKVDRGDLDDVIGEGGGYNDDYYDDEDFM